MNGILIFLPYVLLCFAFYRGLEMRKTKTIGGNRGFVPYRPGSYRPFVPNSGPAPALEGEEEGGELCVCLYVCVGCVCMCASVSVS